MVVERYSETLSSVQRRKFWQAVLSGQAEPLKEKFYDPAGPMILELADITIQPSQ
jgi:hypothetical protein